MTVLKWHMNTACGISHQAAHLQTPPTLLLSISALSHRAESRLSCSYRPTVDVPVPLIKLPQLVAAHWSWCPFQAAGRVHVVAVLLLKIGRRLRRSRWLGPLSRRSTFPARTNRRGLLRRLSVSYADALKGLANSGNYGRQLRLLYDNEGGIVSKFVSQPSEDR